MIRVSYRPIKTIIIEVMKNENYGVLKLKSIVNFEFRAKILEFQAKIFSSFEAKVGTLSKFVKVHSSVYR